MPIIEDEAFRDWPVDENGDDKELKSLEDIPVDEFDLKKDQAKYHLGVGLGINSDLSIWMFPDGHKPL